MQFVPTVKRDILWYARNDHHRILLATLRYFFLPISVTALDIGYVGATLFVLFSGAWFFDRKKIFNNPAILSFWGLFLLLLVGMTYTHATSHQAWHDINKHLYMLFTPFLLFVFSDQKPRIRLFLNVFLASMLMIMVLSYAKVFIWPNYRPELGPAGVFTTHIIQNFCMAFAACIVLYRILNEKQHRWLYVICFILLSFNIIFMSTGRTGYVAYAIFVMFAGIYRYRWKGAIAGLVLVGTLFGLAYSFSSNFNDRLHRLHQDMSQYQQGQTITSLGLKLAMMENSVVLIKRHPWFGYGTGGIKSAFSTLPLEAQKRSGQVDYVEVGYVNFLLSYGVIGFLFFLSMLGVQIYYSFRLQGEYRFYFQAFLAAYLASALFNPFFLGSAWTHLYSLVSAAMLSTFEK